MSVFEQRSCYLLGYQKVLDELKVIKLTKPDVYPDFVRFAKTYRDWVIIAAQTDNVPVVPEQ